MKRPSSDRTKGNIIKKGLLSRCAVGWAKTPLRRVHAATTNARREHASLCPLRLSKMISCRLLQHLAELAFRIAPVDQRATGKPPPSRICSVNHSFEILVET